MDNVEVKKIKSLEGKYLFEVSIGSKDYQVSLARDYWLKLTDGLQPPAQLVLDSFMFLLERETKEQIMPEFDLKDINKYFPEYESKIKK